MIYLSNIDFVKNDSIQSFSGFYFYGEETYTNEGENEVHIESMPSLGGFFIKFKLEVLSNQLSVETDTFGIISLYYYNNKGKFIISDDIYMVVNALKYNGVTLTASYESLITSIIFTNDWSNNTILNEVKKLPTYQLNRIDLTTFEFFYDDHSFYNKSITDIEEAVDKLYDSLDTAFSLLDKNVEYGLGMSGGLDSRVAGYFAKKHNLMLNPIFIGRKRNILGILTYDAKRAMTVNNTLEFHSIKFYNTKLLSLLDKVKNDVSYNLLGSNNIYQNVGYDFEFDFILHGMMGGELFGSLFPNDIDKMNEAQLIDYIMTYLINTSSLSKDSSFIRKVFSHLKSKPSNTKSIIFDNLESSINDSVLYESIRESASKFVKASKKEGMSNAQVVLKDFLTRCKGSTYSAYYSTFNNVYPSYGCYFNDSVLKLISEIDIELLKDKQVQKKLLSRCGGMDQIRAQTLEAPLSKRTNKLTILKNGIERSIRGGGMAGYRWYRKEDFDILINRFMKDEVFMKIYKQIVNHDKSTHTCVLSLIKYFEFMSDNDVKIVNHNDNKKERSKAMFE